MKSHISTFATAALATAQRFDLAPDKRFPLHTPASDTPSGQAASAPPSTAVSTPADATSFAGAQPHGLGVLPGNLAAGAPATRQSPFGAVKPQVSTLATAALATAQRFDLAPDKRFPLRTPPSHAPGGQVAGPSPPPVDGGTTAPNIWSLAASQAMPSLTMTHLTSAWRNSQDANDPLPDFWSLPEANRLEAPSLDNLNQNFMQEWQKDDQALEAARLAKSKTDEQKKTNAKTAKPKRTDTAVATGLDEEAEESSTGASMAEIMDAIADDPPLRWMNLDDPDNYEELADRLYNTLSSRLRFDVLVDRERSGTLLDFS